MIQLYVKGDAVMNEIKKMYCPSCGAPISFEEGREDTFCSHCGSQLHRDDDNIVRRMEHVERKLEHEEKMMEYADRHEEREHESKKQIQDFKMVIKYIIVMVIFMIVFTLLTRWGLSH